MAPELGRGTLGQIRDKGEVRGLFLFLLFASDVDKLPSRMKEVTLKEFKRMYQANGDLAEGFELTDDGKIPWGMGGPKPMGHFVVCSIGEVTGWATICHIRSGIEVTFEDNLLRGVWRFKKNWIAQEAMLWVCKFVFHGRQVSRRLLYSSRLHTHNHHNVPAYINHPLYDPNLTNAGQLI